MYVIMNDKSEENVDEFIHTKIKAAQSLSEFTKDNVRETILDFFMFS
jgi:hypothetical protein